MRLAISDGDGICGINVLPGLYPVVKGTTFGFYSHLLSVDSTFVSSSLKVGILEGILATQ